MKELVMIRHGESEANAKGIWQGRLDFALSERGRGQARMAGISLRSETARISSVNASPLVRAFETAEIIAREAGYGDGIVAVEGLTERGGGLFEGSTWAEREEKMPEVLAEFRGLSEEDGWRMIGAETDEELLARFAPAVEGVMSHAEPDSVTVVVTHGGVMRAYLRGVFGPEVLAGDERAANASVTRLRWRENGRPELVTVADVSHLGDRETTSRAGEPTSE